MPGTPKQPFCNGCMLGELAQLFPQWFRVLSADSTEQTFWSTLFPLFWKMLRNPEPPPVFIVKRIMPGHGACEQANKHMSPHTTCVLTFGTKPVPQEGAGPEVCTLHFSVAARANLKPPRNIYMPNRWQTGPCQGGCATKASVFYMCDRRWMILMPSWFSSTKAFNKSRLCWRQGANHKSRFIVLEWVWLQNIVTGSPMAVDLDAYAHDSSSWQLPPQSWGQISIDTLEHFDTFQTLQPLAVSTRFFSVFFLIYGSSLSVWKYSWKDGSLQDPWDFIIFLYYPALKGL